MVDNFELHSLLQAVQQGDITLEQLQCALRESDVPGGLSASEWLRKQGLLTTSIVATSAEPNASREGMRADDVLRVLAASESAEWAPHSTLTETPLVEGSLPKDNVQRGRYLLREPLGSGGMGIVWRADDPQLGRQVALKELKRQPSVGSQATVWIREEAQTAGRLEHPGIVPVYEVVEPATGAAYYTMRLVEGQTLSEAIQELHAQAASTGPGTAQLNALLRKFIAVCQAVGYANSKGVVHRDLKGANVKLGPFDDVQVLDWGLARTRSEDVDDDATPADGDRQETIPGTRKGTPAYMAPEQARGDSTAIDARTDVYGLGAVMYELLTGRSPFPRPDQPLSKSLSRSEITNEICRQVMEAGPVPPRELASWIPKPLAAICEKAMSRDKEQRYQSATALAEDVVAWLDDRPAEAYPDPWPTKVRRWGARHKTAVAGVAAVLVTATILGTVLTLVVTQNNKDLASKVKELDSAKKDVDSALIREKDSLTAAVNTTESMSVLIKKLGAMASVDSEVIVAAQQAIDVHVDLLIATAGRRPKLIELKAKILMTLSGLHVDHQGDSKFALDKASEAERLLRELLSEQPNKAQWQQLLAETLEQKGVALGTRGRFGEAEQCYDESLRLWEAQYEFTPEDSVCQLGLASIVGRIGGLRTALGDSYGAAEHFERCVKLCQQALQGDPNDDERQRRLAAGLQKLGDAFSVLEMTERSRECWEQSHSLLSPLVELRPQDAPLQRGWFDLLMSIGDKESLKQALELAKQVRAANPKNETWRANFLMARFRSGDLFRADDPIGSRQELEKTLRELVQITNDRAARDPSNLWWQSDVVSMSNFLASVLLSTAPTVPNAAETRAEGLRLLEDSLLLARKLADDAPLAERPNLGVGISLNQLAQQRRGAGDLAAAEEFFKERHTRSAARLRQLVEREPASAAVWRLKLAQVFVTRWADLGVAGDLAGAKQAISSAEENLRIVESLPPVTHLDWLSERARVRGRITTTAWLAAAPGGEAQFNSTAYQEYMKAVDAWLKDLNLSAKRVPIQPRRIRDLAKAYLELTSTLRIEELHEVKQLRLQLGDSDVVFQKYLDELERLYQMFPGEAPSSLFPAAAQSQILDAASQSYRKQNLSLARKSIGLLESLVQNLPTPSRLHELLTAYQNLLKEIDLREPAEQREAQWAARRGLSLLLSRREAKLLHPVQERLVPLFESAVDQLTSSAWKEQPDSIRQALRKLDGKALAKHFGQSRNGEAWLTVLDQEASDANPIEWSRDVAEAFLIEASILEPELSKATLESARPKFESLSMPARKILWIVAAIEGNEPLAQEWRPAGLTVEQQQTILGKFRGRFRSSTK